MTKIRFTERKINKLKNELYFIEQDLHSIHAERDHLIILFTSTKSYAERSTAYGKLNELKKKIIDTVKHRDLVKDELLKYVSLYNEGAGQTYY